MPDVDIQRCVLDSIRIFKATPYSATMRRHDKASLELASSKLVPVKIHLPGSRETSPEFETAAQVGMKSTASFFRLP
eukprot:m.238549 g.238549  ORF g.238549 m.238549 type:complete len:77 (+) comp40165_c1_seq29:358-588(+)